MKALSSVAPVMSRLFGLVVASALLNLGGEALGQPVHWSIAILYGIALGVASRWPIILPVTGTRLVVVSGLLLDALWQFGLPTALAVVVAQFAVLFLSLDGPARIWRWVEPTMAMGGLAAGYGLSLLLGEADPDHLLCGLHTDAAAFVLAYGYWGIANLIRVVAKPPSPNRTQASELLLVGRQTWWVPLVYLAMAWVMTLVHSSGYPLEIPVGLALLLLQRWLGPVFTILHQDRAVGRLIQLGPWQNTAERARAQRVLRMTHLLGRSLRLPDDQIRIAGYAALLQDCLKPAHPPLPIWLPESAGPSVEAAIGRYVADVVNRVAEDGSLTDVAHLIRYRYANFDGTGYPAVAGEEIPMGSQVLAAASAIVYLTDADGGGLTHDDAIRWIQTHASSRFHEALRHAMLSTLSEVVSVTESASLPETIRQLRGLVGSSAPISVARLGFLRAWRQFRGQFRFTSELPPEVQAVAQLSTLFATCKSIDQTAQLLAQAVGQLVSGKVALALSDGDGCDLMMRFRATYDYSHMQLEGRLIAVQGGYMSRTLLNQEPTQLGDMLEASSPLAAELSRVEGIRSVLFVPLVTRGRSTGLLMVGLPHHHWFTPREVGLIRLMAGQAATALENGRLMAEAEERLEHISQLKTFTDTLLDNLVTSIFVVDPSKKVTMANAAARARFAPLLRVGSPLPSELAALFPVSAALGGESPGEQDAPWSQLVLAVQAAPLRDADGTLLGAVCMGRDVTAVRTMEEQVHRVEKLAAIAELAAGAAHEIRNPLTSIRGFIQLLQARQGEGQAEYYRIILGEIDRIDAIIHDLLLLARPSQLHRVPLSLSALLEEVLLLYQSEFQQHGIRVETAVDPALGAVELDPKMIRQLLWNLLINAVQAMPQGGLLTLDATPGEADLVRLVVSDTGMGIAPENLKRLFDPFFTTKEEGTGLGLALCHSIVQAHGGEIQVESQEGGGTTFTIMLPRRATHNE